MRDSHILPGKKIKVSDENLLLLVRKNYPKAIMEGSLGAYSFYQNNVLVAEAYAHKNNGWWLRIKKGE